MDWTAVIIALLGAKELFAFGHKALEHLSEKRKLDRLEQESDKLDEDQVAVLEEGFRTRLSSEQFKWGADYVIVLNVVNVFSIPIKLLINIGR